MITTAYRVDRGSSTTADAVRTAIATRSPTSALLPYVSDIYDLGVSYGVDPALFVAVALYENGFDVPANNNPASISNAYYGGWPVAGSRWGQYPDLYTGIEAFYRLITAEYYPRGQTTIGSIMWGIGGSPTVTGEHAYAPAFENRASYAAEVAAYMDSLSDSQVDSPAVTPASPSDGGGGSGGGSGSPAAAPTWVAGAVFLLALAYLFGGQ